MAAVEKVEEHIADAVAKGATVAPRRQTPRLGRQLLRTHDPDGVTADMLVAREETFGPLAPLFSFSTEEEAIQMANDTDSAWPPISIARDIGRVWRVAEALEYGMVGVNTGLISTEVAPFGGMKESGIGREGSKYGIEEFIEVKYLCMGGV